MNLPNRLSVARLLLTVPFTGTFFLPIENPKTWALALFTIASLTDLADGIIARRHGWITNFGKLIDPLADKVLMTAAEFIVTGIRQIAVSQGLVLAAESLGKHKMIWQVITVCYFLLFTASAEPWLTFLKPLFEQTLLSPTVLGQGCIWLTTALTVVSGWRYFWLNRSLFRDA
jgi:CDP-diacylglycerol---glycerol-3-phosphate 3-phosphatidyltransferase